ncbi:MAG: XRE family transcriptional regulator, partial [Lachnospiraceae bacterium]|nr:XRE family transcriptional regulator [Lachnospiraceae bacterium]
MRISRDKVDICRARKKKSVAELAEAYGVSR